MRRGNRIRVLIVGIVFLILIWEGYFRKKVFGTTQCNLGESMKYLNSLVSSFLF